MPLTAAEKKQADVLEKAVTALAERVIGNELCGCGSPSDAIQLLADRVKIRNIGGEPVEALIPKDAYVALCARCAAAMGEGGDA